MAACNNDDPNKCPVAEDVAERAADAAVEKTFAILGVNIREPKEVEEFREDLRFAGKLREVVGKSTTAMVVASATLIVGAVFAALWSGFKIKVGAP